MARYGTHPLECSCLEMQMLVHVHFTPDVLSISVAIINEYIVDRVTHYSTIYLISHTYNIYKDKSSHVKLWRTKYHIIESEEILCLYQLITIISPKPPPPPPRYKIFRRGEKASVT